MKIAKRFLASLVLSLILFNTVAFATAYDITAATYVTSKNVANQDSGLRDIVFNNTGSKLFLIGSTNKKVYEYALSSNFDLSTASYSTGEDFDVSGEATSQPQGLTFNDDGTKMYVTDGGIHKVIEYDVSPAYDVSTATSPYSITVSNDGFSSPLAVRFNSAGTKMFVAGSNIYVFTYNLATPFDLSTATYSALKDLSSVNGNVQQIRSMEFNDDGTKLFTIGYDATDDVFEFNLSSAYDISTASAGNTFDYSGEMDPPNGEGITFSGDGLKMYLLGGGEVFEYSIPDGSSVPEFSTYVYIVTILLLMGIAYSNRQLFMARAK